MNIKIKLLQVIRINVVVNRNLDFANSHEDIFEE